MLTRVFLISAENRQMENSQHSKKKFVPASPAIPAFFFFNLFKKTFFFSFSLDTCTTHDTETEILDC